MNRSLYNTLRWRAARSRAIERDHGRCTVSRLLGGDCSPGPLHAHHIVRPEDGGSMYGLDNLGTTCATHHPKWEALRRSLTGSREPTPVRCRHQHRTREGREVCERRLARARTAA